MDIFSIILVAVLGILAAGIIFMYNKFISLRNKVEEAFALMDVYLKKRYELIPNLVAAIKGYMDHEATTLEKVVKARANATNRGSQLDAESDISQNLGSIMIVAEKYPALKANEGFEQLHKQLKEIECDIESSRRYYNGSIREYNTTIQTFPNNLIASALHFGPMKMFEATSAERNSVNVGL